MPSWESIDVGRVVTVEISEAAVQRAQEVARRTDRRIEDVLAEWLERLATEPSVEIMPDHQVLAICEQQMEPHQQEELSDLLDHQREGTLTDSEQTRLDELMRVYRQGLVRKAQAFQVA